MTRQDVCIAHRACFASITYHRHLRELAHAWCMTLLISAIFGDFLRVLLVDRHIACRASASAPARVRFVMPQVHLSDMRCLCAQYISRAPSSDSFKSAALPSLYMAHPSTSSWSLLMCSTKTAYVFCFSQSCPRSSVVSPIHPDHRTHTHTHTCRSVCQFTRHGSKIVVQRERERDEVIWSWGGGWERSLRCG
jgi:hypothetical protein